MVKRQADENDDAPTIGHNRGISVKALKGVIREIETAEDEKALIAESIKDIYTTAKAKGFDVAVLRSIVRDRKADREKLREFNEVKMAYLLAIDPELADVLS